MFNLLRPDLTSITDGRVVSALKRHSHKHPRAVRDRLEGMNSKLATRFYGTRAKSPWAPCLLRGEQGTWYHCKYIAQVETLFA